MGKYSILPLLVIVIFVSFSGCKKQEAQQNKMLYTEVVQPKKPDLKQTVEVSGTVVPGVVHNNFTNNEFKITKLLSYKGEKVKKGQELIEGNDISGNSASGTSTISAAMTGVITELAPVGTVYSVKTEKPIVSIADLKNLLIKTKVAESDISKIKIGLPVNIKSECTNKILKGKVSRIESMADPDTEKGIFIPIYVSFDNLDEILKPNYSVYLSIDYSLNKDTLMLPKISIVTEGEKSFVYTIDKDNVVHKKYIKTGTSTDTATQVIGLSQDIKVIKNISPIIKDGAKLNPKELIFK